MAATYRIVDEPRPSGLQHLVVSPLWPLFAVMFAGHTFSWIWFGLNGHAMGSPTRNRELALVGAGFFSVFALRVGIGTMVGNGIIPAAAGPYLNLAVVLVQLGLAYWLYVLQMRTFHIYEYYGGAARNGIGIVILAALFWPRVLSKLQGLPLLWLVFA